MGEPVRLLLTNAVAAALIAALAWVASLTVRRASVVHALWLLALVKLVTPPIAPLPVLPAWSSPLLFSERRAPTVVAIPAPERAAAFDRKPTPDAAGPAAFQTPKVDARTAKAAPLVVTMPDLGRPTLQPGPAGALDTAGRPAVPVDWRPGAAGTLAVGALAILGLAAVRFARFRRLLATARPAPHSVAERAEGLAARIGLRRCPRVRQVAAGIPPMLWPDPGGPLLLLPEKLLPTLRPDELDALLAHELAHVRRRDHWVRLVEIAATALFWWYPVTWWARKALRRAEERCCDEWVLRLLPRSAEAYANGLLKSLAFVADPPVPAVASGAGPVEDLEARLKEILMTRPVPPLSVPLRLALAIAAALGLAVFPTHAQSSARKDEPAATPRAAEAMPTAATAAATPAPDATPAAAQAGPKATPRPAVAGPVAAPIASLLATPRLAPLAAGVRGGVLAGVPGGVVGGIHGGVVGPLSLLAPAAALVVAEDEGLPEAERRAFDEQRRALDDKRRTLQQQEREIEGQSLELEGRARQAELDAELKRVRAEGDAAAVARVEAQGRLNARRLEIQRRQLQLEAEQSRLEAEMEKADREGGERAAEAVQKKQEALEAQMRQAEEQLQALEAEEHVQELRSSTDELVSSLKGQLDSLREALATAPAQKADLEREIKRLEAALAALEGSQPASSPKAKTPAAQP